MSDKEHPLSTDSILDGEAKNKTEMLRTQNNATNSYYFNTAVNNNNKTNSYLAIPFYDYPVMTITLRVCRFLCVINDKYPKR